MTIIGGRSTVFERVVADEWLMGEIEEIQFEKDRRCRVYNNEEKQWEDGTQDQVRLVFRLDGYKFRHYSQWMRASTHKKSTLYSKYLSHLCPQYDVQGKAVELDLLKGTKVKIMWENDGEYQNVSQIRAVDPTLNIIASGQDIGETTVDDTPPF